MVCKQLYHLIADGGIEELWYFSYEISELNIKLFWKEFQESEEESFEDFMNNKYPEVECEREYVTEIYV